jgi:hypothetical protein
MTLKFVIALLTAIMLYGCASCPIQTISKVTPANKAKEVHAQIDGLHTMLKLDGDVTIDIRSCWDTGLCADISIPEGRRFQFSTNEFVEIDVKSGKVTETHKTDQIYYVITCEERKTMARKCISSESSPTLGNVHITATSNSSHNDWKWQYYKKAFSSTLEFTGAREIKGSLSKPLFSLQGQRKYQLPILTEHKSAEPYIIRFPLVSIDGKPHKLADIQVSRVNEPVCNYRAW